MDCSFRSMCSTKTEHLSSILDDVNGIVNDLGGIELSGAVPFLQKA